MAIINIASMELCSQVNYYLPQQLPESDIYVIPAGEGDDDELPGNLRLLQSPSHAGSTPVTSMQCISETSYVV